MVRDDIGPFLSCMIDVLEKRGKDASMEKKSVSTKGGIKMVWTMGQRYYRHPPVLYSLGDEKMILALR